MAWKYEKRDLLDLLLCFGAVISFWLILGWRPGLIFSRQDGLEFFYAAIHIVRDAGKGLDGPAYDPFLLGGTKFAATWISPWFTKLFLLARLKIVNIVFLSLIFPQIFHGFLSLKLLDGFLAWNEQKADRFWVWALIERMAWTIIFAFPPLLAWRIAGGHLYYPSLFPLALMALILGMKTRSFGVTGFLASGAILFTCFDTETYPQLVNAAVFAGPLVAFLFWKAKPWNRSELLLFLGLAVGCACWNLRGHIEAILYYTGSDATRSLMAKDIIHSIGIPGFRDWLSGLFWDLRAIPSPRSLNAIAEFNYPLGPVFFLFFLSLFYFRNAVSLLCFTLLAVCMLFASNVFPVTNILVTLVPVLNSFRAPARSIFPLYVIMLPLAATALVHPWKGIRPQKNYLYSAAALLVLALCLLKDPLLRELILFLSVLLTCTFGNLPGLRSLLLCTLALFSLLSFQQRFPPPLDLSQTEARAKIFSEEILIQAPELRNPLERAHLEFKDDKFVANTGMLLNISSLDGYWLPARQFNEAVYEAYGLPAMGVAMNYRILPEDPGSKKLFPLYNVNYLISVDAGKPIVKKTASAGSWARLAGLTQANKKCDSRKIESAEVTDRYFAATVKVSGNENDGCALVLATNYAEGFHAKSGNYELEVFPVGPLLGIGLPAGPATVEIGISRLTPEWMKFIPLVSLALLFLSAQTFLRGFNEE